MVRKPTIFFSALSDDRSAGVLIGALLFVLAPLLIRVMGAEGDFAAMAVQYLRVYALCSPVTTIVFAMDNYLKICGKVRTSMVLNIVMSAMIVGLEFTFLYVLKWGVGAPLWRPAWACSSARSPP